ncbi:permease [Paenibacillus aestuarii]|uniref:Permease n=1 Tax=Paenibacillus aestuarii TaxID=516965 RepID=A0ABW0K8Y8_9BACL|nr:permease [Paenibacillus aestuarii]
MQISLFQWSRNIVVTFGIIFLVYVFLQSDLSIPSLLESNTVQTFKTMFISIILEAIPFVLLGVVLSSILQVFVSEKFIQRIIPKNPILGILFACLLGIIFPVCECGMIPVVRRLIQKGMPVYVAIVFILTGPIINPIVYAATFMAFRTHPDMVYARMGLAFAVAAVIGFILHKTLKKSPLKQSLTHFHAIGSSHAHDHDHDHDHDHHYNRLSSMLSHAAEEFFEMGKFLMFGAMLTALIQTFVVRESLVAIGHGTIISHLFMTGFAYILSLCSTSDAFVASSFLTTFSKGSLLTFMVVGPMLDFKSTLMLLSVFKKRFVLVLSMLIAIFTIAGSMIIEHFYF